MKHGLSTGLIMAQVVQAVVDLGHDMRVSREGMKLMYA